MEATQARQPKTDNVPFCHLELMSQKAENRIGKEPYILILDSDYQTNGTDKIIAGNLTESAEQLNTGNPAADDDFPYIKYERLVNRWDAWVYVSMRDLPGKEAEIKAWLLKVATAYTIASGVAPADVNKKMKVDDSVNPATIYKIAWRSTDLVPK